MVENFSFNLSNLQDQSFPFPEKVMEYVNKEADAETKQKLDRTCKHFYKEAPHFFVDTVNVDGWFKRFENVEYDGCIDITSESGFEEFLPKIDNIWVTEKVKIHFKGPIGASLLDKIVRCDAYEVSIYRLDLSFKKFKILVKSGNVKDLNCCSPIFDCGCKLPLEFIFEMVPNIRTVRLNKAHITPVTMTQLNAFSWKQKLDVFCLWRLDGLLDIELFHKFVDNHVEPINFKIGITFNGKIIKNGEPLADKLLNVPRDVPKKLKTVSNSSIPLPPLSFNADNIIRQYFDLPYPVMCYILQSADPVMLRKLYRTCKYFYNRMPYCIIENIDLCGFLNANRLANKSNIWVTNVLHFARYYHQVASRIVRCDAKEIRLPTEKITTHEMEALTYTGCLKTWDAWNTNVINEDGKIISCEEMMAYLPNAVTICARVQGVARQPSSSKISIPATNKIKKLILEVLDETVNVNMLYDFLTKVLAPKAVVELNFPYEMPTFNAEMKKKLDVWRPQIQKPTLIANWF